MNHENTKKNYFCITVKCASFLIRYDFPKKLKKQKCLSLKNTLLDSHSSHYGKKQNPFMKKLLKGALKLYLMSYLCCGHSPVYQTLYFLFFWKTRF